MFEKLRDNEGISGDIVTYLDALDEGIAESYFTHGALLDYLYTSIFPSPLSIISNNNYRIALVPATTRVFPGRLYACGT